MFNSYNIEFLKLINLFYMLTILIIPNIIYFLFIFNKS